MNSVNIKKILITFIIFLIVFSACWFGYQQFFVSKPIQKQLNEMTHAELVQPLKVQQDIVNIDFGIKDESSLQDATSEIKKILSESDYEQYQMNFVPESQETSENLEQIWDSSMLRVMEIMHQEKYSELFDLMQDIEMKHEGVTAEVSADEEYVYITLSQNESSLYRILPLTELTMEAW